MNNYQQKRGSVKTRNRREEPEVGEWWEVVMSMGMPTLYLIATISGLIGIICHGVVSKYWADLNSPACFLYAQTASNMLFYQFGSSVVICNWVTYGALTGIIIAVMTGVYYVFMSRGDKKRLDLSMTIVLLGIFLSFMFTLAAACTLAEGMRITCASMGLNSANNKGSNCYDKLDTRVSQYNLPIKTSTMVRAAMGGIYFSTTILFIIACFHISDGWRRYRRSSFEEERY